MARRLLLGRAGTGKTHVCLDGLTRALGQGERALLLVPTYSQAEHLRYALLDRSQGLSEHTVETFSSLAERLTGMRLRDLVPLPVRDRIAAAVLNDVFPEAAGHAGLRAEFLDSVKEIKEQGDPIDEIVSKARAHFDQDSRGRRLFEGYLRYVERLPAPGDHEDLLLLARARAGEKARPLRLLLVDGFHDFTPVQRDIIDRLAERAEETIVTLPLDPDQRTHPIFATAARTARAFDGYTEEALRGNRRATGALARLEQVLFASPGAPTDGAGIELLVCPSEEDEADRLARLVAASGRPFNDFLLVRRNFNDLHALYRAAFSRYGIPLRFYAPEPFTRSPAARAATLWLRTLAGEPELADLIPLLRSPYFYPRPRSREVDLLAKELRERKRPELPACVRPRDGRLATLLRDELGVRDALVENPDGDEEIARAARLFALLAEEAEAIEDLPLAEAAERLLRRLPMMKAKQHDRRHDCVFAVDALDARQWEKPVVIVAGLSADAFPRQVRQDLFLRDEERRELAETRGLSLPLRSRREDEERYLFYVACTRARERLVLSYAAFDEIGTPSAPSPYLEETLLHFTDVARREIPLAEQYAQPRDAVRREDLYPIVADGLVHGVPLAASLWDLDAVNRTELARPHRLELARVRPLSRPPPPRKLSPSSMGDFLKCPYLFLMKKVLYVSRPRAEALDPLMRGNIVHEALERYARDGGDPAEIFDAIFLEQTAGIRIGLEEEAHRRWMRSAVLRTAKKIAGAPVETVEHKFELEVGDARVRGRIDRIDAYPTGKLVVDYKTGTQTKLQPALDLEQVQLDTYLLEVDRAAGAVYDMVRTGESIGYVLPELKEAFPGKMVQAMTRAEFEERAAATRALIEKIDGDVKAGRLAVKPRKPEECKRNKCDGYDLCRVARSRWLAKAARCS